MYTGFCVRKLYSRVDGLSSRTMTPKIHQNLHRNSIHVLQWSSQSPDLNPNKNLWSELKRAIHKRKPKDVNDSE